MSARLIVRITPEQERMLVEMCEREQRTVADMVRIAIMEAHRARFAATLEKPEEMCRAG